MSTNDTLPFGWVEVPLAEYLINKDGARIPVSAKEREGRQGEYPYYGATGQIDSLDSFTHEGENILIGEDGANLLSRVKPTSFIARGSYWVNNHAHVVSCYNRCSNKYFNYYFNSLALDEWVSGTAQPKLNQKNMGMIPVKVAPAAEKIRIVQKLDQLIAQVDTLKARVDAIPSILKNFRQSVLAAAVSGKLTEEWRENNPLNKSVDEINGEINKFRYKFWEAAQYEKFEIKGKVPKNNKWKEKYKEPSYPDGVGLGVLPPGWVHQPLDGLVYIAARIGWKGLKASEYTKEGPLFLSVHSLNYGQHVKLDEAYHISQDRYEESPEIMLKNDDILLCKDGAGIGKVSILKDLKEPATINSSLLLIRSGEYFITEYLYYFFAGPKMQSLVQERMTGTAVPHLFQRDVKEFVLEVPPINEQKEIVRRVEQFFAIADQIEGKVTAAQKHINHLTQSIFAKAFKGELVPQDPSDEPAPDLLVRIKAQREAEQPKNSAKTKKKG